MNIYTMILSAGIALWAGWQVQEYRYGEIINDIKFEQSEAARKVFESAHRQYLIDIAQKDKALNEATLRSQKNATLARALDSDIDRLRDELTATRTSLSTASCETVRKHAETLSVVFGQCSERYSDLARNAQGHLSDVILLEQAWPKR